MSDRDEYSPLGSLRSLRSQMQRKITEAGDLVIPGSQVAPPITVERRIAPCCVLLKALTDHGPVPDDFTTLTSAAAVKAHVRSDGAVYLGAFELAGKPDSVVLVYGDPMMPVHQAERFATRERPALERRLAHWKLGPFAAPVVAADPLSSSTSS